MKISKEKLQQMIMEELALLDEKINIKVGSSDDAIEKALGLNPKDEPWKSTDLDKWQMIVNEYGIDYYNAGGSPGFA